MVLDCAVEAGGSVRRKVLREGCAGWVAASGAASRTPRKASRNTLHIDRSPFIVRIPGRGMEMKREKAVGYYYPGVRSPWERSPPCCRAAVSLWFCRRSASWLRPDVQNEG